MIRRCFASLSAVLLTPAVFADLPEEAAQPAYLSTIRDQLERVADHDHVVGFAAAVIEAGEPVLLFTHGETEAGSGEAVTPETLFRAASVSKTFTGTLLALMEHEGALDLDMEMPPDILELDAPREPTLLEIASHQTGLPPNAYDLDLEAGQSPERIRERLGRVDLLCPVGDCYTYQNVAFSSVEPLVEDATGMDFESAIDAWIFQRLNMPSASIGVDDLESQDSWARPHRGWRRTSDQAGNPRTNYDAIPSAAGVNVSLNDMIVWAQAQLGMQDGLPDPVLHRSHDRIVETRRETRRLGPLRQRVDTTWYGLGWRIYDWGDRTFVMHSGYLSGYGAQIVVEPETGFGFVALWNSDNRPARWVWPAVVDIRDGRDGSHWLDRFYED